MASTASELATQAQGLEHVIGYFKVKTSDGLTPRGQDHQAMSQEVRRPKALPAAQSMQKSSLHRKETGVSLSLEDQDFERF
jgi:predicted SprT family Zn-dependent metalloprotease